MLDPTTLYLLMHGGMDDDVPVSAEVWAAVRLECWREWLAKVERSPICASLPHTAELYDGPDAVATLRAIDPQLGARVDALLHHRYLTITSATPGRVYWPVRWTGNAYQITDPRPTTSKETTP